MKTKKLIELLQKEDPSGEEECCVGNCDIFFVAKEPAFHDGRLQVLVRDKSKEPYYNVVGAKYKSSGHKITIRTLSIEDAIWDNVDLPVDVSEVPHYQESIDKIRQDVRNFNKEMEQEKIEKLNGKAKSTMKSKLNDFWEAIKYIGKLKL